jgi:hypothetical protein
MDSKPASHLRAVATTADEGSVVSNFIDPVDAEFIARSNAILVTIDNMFRGSDEIHKLPREEMNWDGRMDCLTRIFRGQRDKAFVVNSRFEAMSRLVNAGKVPYGVVPMDTAGWSYLANSVLLAAAEMPILFLEKDPYFDPEPFAAFVLRDAKACGGLVLRAVKTQERIGYPIRPYQIDG